MDDNQKLVAASGANPTASLNQFELWAADNFHFPGDPIDTYKHRFVIVTRTVWILFRG